MLTVEKNISRNELDTIFLSIYKGPSSSQNTGTLHYTSTLITMFLGGTGGSIRPESPICILAKPFTVHVFTSGCAKQKSVVYLVR
jgi:hypothetical protein